MHPENRCGRNRTNNSEEQVLKYEQRRIERSPPLAPNVDPGIGDHFFTAADGGFLPGNAPLVPPLFSEGNVCCRPDCRVSAGSKLC